MASPGRRSARDLIDEICADGPHFRFFQAVRLLALAQGTREKEPGVPAQLRFGSPLTLSFLASEIVEVRARQDGPVTRTQPNREAPPFPDAPPNETTSQDAPHALEGESGPRSLNMTLGFMGMTGPSGVLPRPYTEMLIDRRNQFRDVTAHRFLDMFTHRAVALFYQAWRKHRFYLPYEASQNDRFSRNILDLIGVGLANLQRRLESLGGGIPDRFLIHYAGLLTQRPIPPVNIAALIRGYFGIEATIRSFVGHWVPLPVTEQSALDGRPCRLGRTAFIGERLWDRQTKMRIELGPLSREEFARFLPGQPGLNALRQLAQFCVGLTLDCDLKLILRKDAIPHPVLGYEKAKQIPLQLGYSAWLNTSPPSKHADDVCFNLLGHR